jgi:predicted metalloprotease
MKITLPGRKSDDVIDRRGASTGRTGGLPITQLAGMGIPGIIIIVVIMLLGGGGIPGTGGGGGGFGVDAPFDTGAPAGSADSVPGAPDPEAAAVEFVSFVLDDIQVSWSEQFAQAGKQYEDAKLVLFTTGVESGCGFAPSSTGPFYCPADQMVYLDLGFFEELAGRYNAPGDFAQAYVIAHEIGHHIQNITGISDEVRSLQQQNPDDANELSIRLELQADCLAGVWGYTTYERGILESGDVEEGLGAAAAVGDDRIQKESTGRINQDTWTHGSSEQRVEWFRRGFDSGDASKCDTFDGNI